MLKVAQQNTIPFNNLTKNINYQLLIEGHSRKSKNAEKRSRYRRSDDEELDGHKLSLPSNFLPGNAVGEGDCFFDSLAQGINQLSIPGGPFTVQSLRQTCFEYARDNPDSVYDSRTDKTWRQAIAEDAVLGWYATDGSEQNKFDSYLVRIQLTAEGMKGSNLGAAIWGRPEIEGRMICQQYGIKLHVVEKHPVDGQEVIVHSLEDGSRSRQLNDKQIYNDPKVVHILNEKRAHFVPILHKSSASNKQIEKQARSSPIERIQSQDNPVDRLAPYPDQSSATNSQRELAMPHVSKSDNRVNRQAPQPEKDSQSANSANLQADNEANQPIISSNIVQVSAVNNRELLIAAGEGNVERIRSLIENEKVYVNFQDRDGNTALHHAGKAGKLETIELLLANGADISIENNNGKAPLATKNLKKEDVISVVFSAYLKSVHKEDEKARNIFKKDVKYKESENILPMSESHYLILNGEINKNIPGSPEYEFSATVIDLVRKIITEFDRTFSEILKLDERFLKILKSDKTFRENLKENEKFIEIFKLDKKFSEVLESDERFLEILESDERFREILKSDERFLEILESDENLCNVLKYDERFFEQLKSDGDFLKILKSNKNIYEILRKNEKFLEILNSPDKDSLKKLRSDENFREVLESDERFFETLRRDEKIIKKLKSINGIKIPDGKNFLFYIIKDKENKLKEIFVAISGSGISFSSGIVKEAAMAGEKDYSRDFEKFQGALNSVVKDYNVKGTLVPFSRKEERFITKDNNSYNSIQNTFNEKYKTDSFIKMSLISKILQGEFKITAHALNTILKDKMDFFIFISNLNNARLISKELVKNNKNSGIDIESITIKLLEEIDKKPKKEEKQKDSKYKTDYIEENIGFLKSKSRFIYLDTFREIIDIFINSENAKVDIDRYRKSLKNLWKVSNKIDIYSMIQYQARCSEDNLIDYLSYNSDILKKEGKHYIFSVEKGKGISKNNKSRTPIRAPCSYCILHFPLEFSDIIASSKAGLPTFDFKKRLGWPVSIDNFSIDEKFLYLIENTPESYLKNIFFDENRYSSDLHAMYLINAVKRNMRDILKNFLNINLYKGGQNKALYDAALVGSEYVIEYLIKKKPSSIDHKNNEEGGNTALHAAVKNNHIKVVEILLNSAKNKIDIISKPNNDGLSPLVLASRYKRKDILKLLIDKTPESRKVEIITNKNKGGSSVFLDTRLSNPLHAAIDNSNIEIIRYIWELQKEKTKPEINIVEDINGNLVEFTPLHIASGRGDYEIVKYLVEEGFLIENNNHYQSIPNKIPITTLNYAINFGHKETAAFLLKNMMDKKMIGNIKKSINSSYNGFTALHHLSMYGFYEIIENLLLNITPGEKKEAVCFVTEKGKTTPLHLAVFAYPPNKKIINFLLKNGADVHAESKNGITPLHWAAFSGHLDVVRTLFENGALVGAEVDSMMPWAAFGGHLDVVRTLFENGALVGAKMAEITSLHFAAENGHLNVVKYLLKKGALVNAKTYVTPAKKNDYLKFLKMLSDNVPVDAEAEMDGITALHLAAQEGHLDVVETLLACKADIEAQTTNKGYTPLHLAACKGHLDVVKNLLNYFSSKNPEDNKFKEFIDSGKNNNITPLFLAASNGHLDVVETLLKRGARVDHKINYESTPLHTAAGEGYLEVVETLLAWGARVDASMDNNITPLHLAAQEGYLDVVVTLLVWEADIEAQTTDKGYTPLHLAAEEGYLKIVETLLAQRANADAITNSGMTASQLAGRNKHKNVVALLVKHKQRLLSESMRETAEQAQQILEPVVDEAGLSCGSRRRRDLRGCGGEQEGRVFPYEPLEERAPIAERQAAQLYSQLALVDAWQSGESPDTLLRYQRYLGEILEEGEANQSPREQRLLREHYQQALSFFQNHPKATLLETRADDFAPLAGRSVLLESDQQSLLVFNEGPRYQLYGPDFNYRQRFHTRPGVSWSELSAFVQAFFQWKSGRGDYQVLTLQELPLEARKSLREAPFWKPEALVPDSVLLAREHSRGIEGIPAEVVRELIRVNGQVVEASALHADFFQQTAGIQLRVEHLHVVLGELTSAQRRALVQVVRKYQWAADSTLLESLDAEARPLFADYQQWVMTELKTAETLTPERLAEFSWQAMQQAFKRADISPELTQQALTHLKELQATSAKRAWAKGMATQTLFFLPDMIRAANTGQVDGLVRMGGMLAADSTVNQLYGNLLERLTPTLSEARLGLLRKLPVTSPVFKALTVYSIVELTQQLQSLPPDSEQRATIKHRLGEQYVTAGLMVAELFGWELGPVWIVLIAEQLIFEAITFRKENQLDIPVWEALIMSLGFEQAKLQNIFEERQLVELNLGLVNHINSQPQLQNPYGLVLVRVPTLGPLTWRDIEESQIPPAIRQQIISQEESFTPLPSALVTATRSAGSFRRLQQCEAGKTYLEPVGFIVVSCGKIMNTTWQLGTTAARPTALQVHWKPSGRRSHQEDNRFLKQLTIPQGVNSTFERLVSVAGSGYQAVVAHSPVQITGEGLAALYAVKQPPATTASQKNLFLGFDPREGDISLEMHSSGWRALARDYRGAPLSTSFTVQVGPKGYPPAILFQPNLGVLRVEDKSRRLHGDYVISSDSTPFYLYDDTLTTRIAITPPSDRPIGFMVRSYDLNMLQLQTWTPKRSHTRPELPPLPTDRNPVALKKALQALLPQQISTLHLPNKQYLQLMLKQQQIAGVLTLAAEQVEVLFAKGQDAYQSGIFMTANVTNFTVTLLGHLQIMQGSTHLFFIGEVPKAELIRYSKTPSAPHLPVYQLELPALQPVLESLSRPNPQEIQFSTSGLNYAWVPGVEHPSALKIMGPYQGQPAQLLLEHRRSILSELTGHRPRRLVVDHYNPHATLDSQLVLQQAIPGGGESHLAYLDGRCDSLLFQSAEGYSVIHRFPAQQTLTLNGIDYQVIGKQLYAMGAPNGIIDGEQLIRYRTANRRVAIRLNQSLAESTLSQDQDSLTINQLTLRHLPNQTPIVLGEQAFPLKALKESIHRHRHRRELPRAKPELPSLKPLASGASQNKPWTSTLIRQMVTLLGTVNWEWPALFSAEGSQKPAALTSGSGQPTPQGLQTVGEYTVGHLQGGLQLADLLMRKMTKKRYQHSGTCAPTPLTEAEARLASLQQQYASFASHDNLAANPYRGHRVDMLSTPQWTATPINRD